MSRRRRSIDEPPYLSDLRIVLVGKTGAGKSATGNTILGREVFKEDWSADSVTKSCEKQSGVVGTRNIDVIDTPGLFDTRLTKDNMKTEIERCIDILAPGPHVFLLVVRLGRFTEEEQNTVKWIQENFGEEASKYTIVLFTHGDDLKNKTIKEYLEGSSELRRLTNSCGNRYHVFNNNMKGDQTQATELLRKIDDMVTGNGGGYYTRKEYEEAQRKMKNKQWKEWGKDVAIIAGYVTLAAAAGAAAGVNKSSWTQ